MCTLSIHRSPQELLVTMNRDEARTRGPEIPPARWDGPVALLAPRDSAQGGTWMAVNEDGVTACLLNKYEDQQVAIALDPDRTFQSRGHIIPQVLRQGAAQDCLAFLRGDFDPRPYLPFTLVLAALEGLWSFTWRGAGAFEEDARPEEWTVFSSSFLDTGAVLAWRKKAFEEWLQNGAAMQDGVPSFNLHQPEGRETWAPLMDRDISATRSITQARITRDGTSHVLRWSPVLNKTVSMRRYTLPLPVGNGAPTP